jgi:hypothetical protein
MSITTLYAELVVVGTGALLSVLLLVYAFFGASWVPNLSADSVETVISLVPVLSAVYLLGIIIVNISHNIFHGLEEHLRTQALGKDKYVELQTELFTSPNVQSFVHDFEFRRSKVRICRGWYFNCLLIMVALLACYGTGRITLQITAFGCVGLGLLAAGTFVSWRTATTTELKLMQSFIQQRSKAQSPKQPTPQYID